MNLFVLPDRSRKVLSDMLEAEWEGGVKGRKEQVYRESGGCDSTGYGITAQRCVMKEDPRDGNERGGAAAPADQEHRDRVRSRLRDTGRQYRWLSCWNLDWNGTKKVPAKSGKEPGLPMRIACVSRSTFSVCHRRGGIEKGVLECANFLARPWK